MTVEKMRVEIPKYVELDTRDWKEPAIKPRLKFQILDLNPPKTVLIFEAYNQFNHAQSKPLAFMHMSSPVDQIARLGVLCFSVANALRLISNTKPADIERLARDTEHIDMAVDGCLELFKQDIRHETEGVLWVLEAEKKAAEAES